MKKIYWKTLKRTTVFIDTSNIIYSLKDLGWKIDYKKLMSFFKEKTNLINIYFYSAYFKSNSKQKNLFSMLSRKGFIIRTKQVKQIKTQSGTVYKGNLDTELVIDAIDQKSKFDTLILFSGDSDFAPLITYLHKFNKKIISISSRGHVSKEIIQVSDHYLWLEDFSKQWCLNPNLKNHKTPPKRGSGRIIYRHHNKNINKSQHHAK